MVVAIITITSFMNSSSGAVLAVPGHREGRSGGAEGGEVAQRTETSRAGRWEPRRVMGGREQTKLATGYGAGRGPVLAQEAEVECPSSRF